MQTQSTLVVVLVAVITTTGFVPVGSALSPEESPADATGTEDPVQAHHDLASTLQAHRSQPADHAMLEAAHALAEDRPTPGSDRAPGDVGPLLDAQQDQRNLAEHLTPLLDDPSTNDDAAFQAARLALDHRQGLAGEELPNEIAPLLDQQQRNLDLAETLTTESDPADDDRATAIATAQHASPWQATTLDLDTADPVPLTGYTTPSQALLELANRHNATPTSQQLDELQRLDDLEDPVRSALARTVDAFLALDTATQLAYKDADRQALQELSNDDTRSIQDPTAIPASLDADPAEPLTPAALADVPALPSPEERLAEAGVDLAPVLETRAQFLDAVHNLQIALDEADIATAQACEPVQVAPAFSIGLTACDDTYTTDVALQLDAGGTDTYHNNAGGSNLANGACSLKAGVSAALVDLGTGDEAYGNPDAPRECGANGGGDLGVGLLLDEGGNDTYTAGDFGTNGGGSRGVGFLFDAAGDDTYTAGGAGTNGGGDLGVGLLLDEGGDDTYKAGRFGTNGGGALGVGFLLDEGGDDTYTAGSSATNGGTYLGVGFLLDAAGDDTYNAGGYGTNGGGYEGTSVIFVGELVGVGLLLDEGGNDTYTAGWYGTNGGGSSFGDDRSVGFLLDAAGDDTYTAGSYGTNGGSADGVGFLLDAAGDDAYTAGRSGTNGGGSAGGVGFLLDEAGNDTYNAGSEGTNGGGSAGGVGFLLDAAGDDAYTAGRSGTNGGGYGGVGFLLDAAGDDTYTADRYGTNGGGYLRGAGLLLDEAGDDTYTAGDFGTNGGGAGGVGFLLDAAGTDRYEDPAVPDGSCQDCTLVPKGTLGAQVDSDDA